MMKREFVLRPICCIKQWHYGIYERWHTNIQLSFEPFCCFCCSCCYCCL